VSGKTALPQLEIGDADPRFDEAVILINGHEEETIRIECDGALELADRLIRFVNSQEQIIEALTAASYGLRRLNAPSLAAHCETIAKLIGTQEIYDTIAASDPSLRRGVVRCGRCGSSRIVDSAKCLRDGWPLCCGATMSIEKPAKCPPT
jgi:hypothetical protein